MHLQLFIHNQFQRNPRIIIPIGPISHKLCTFFKNDPLSHSTMSLLRWNLCNYWACYLWCKSLHTGESLFDYKAYLWWIVYEVRRRIICTRHRWTLACTVTSERLRSLPRTSRCTLGSNVFNKNVVVLAENALQLRCFRKWSFRRCRRDFFQEIFTANVDHDRARKAEVHVRNSVTQNLITPFLSQQAS